MKKILLSLSLVFSFCNAATIGISTNQVGGSVVLTDVPCKDKKTWLVYTTSPYSSTLFGCFFWDDSFIHVIWSDGTTRSYPFNGFEYSKKTY